MHRVDCDVALGVDKAREVIAKLVDLGYRDRLDALISAAQKAGVSSQSIEALRGKVEALAASRRSPPAIACGGQAN